MAKNEKKTIKEVVEKIIDENKSVDENVTALVNAYDNGEFGTYTIGALQSHLGEYYASFVRTIHLR